MSQFAAMAGEFSRGRPGACDRPSFIALWYIRACVAFQGRQEGAAAKCVMCCVLLQPVLWSARTGRSPRSTAVSIKELFSYENLATIRIVKFDANGRLQMTDCTVDSHQAGCDRSRWEQQVVSRLPAPISLSVVLSVEVH